MRFHLQIGGHSNGHLSKRWCLFLQPGQATSGLCTKRHFIVLEKLSHGVACLAGWLVSTTGGRTVGDEASSIPLLSTTPAAPACAATCDAVACSSAIPSAPAVGDVTAISGGASAGVVTATLVPADVGEASCTRPRSGKASQKVVPEPCTPTPEPGWRGLKPSIVRNKSQWYCIGIKRSHTCHIFCRGS
jgi:hypothetical protein